LVQSASGSVITVHQAHIDRLSAERLIVERNGPGTAFRAEVTSGALLNLDIKNVVIQGGADLPTFDSAKLGGLDQLKISVALSLLSGPVSGSGVLSSVTETGAPRRTGMIVVRSPTRHRAVSRSTSTACSSPAPRYACRTAAW
jgi:hypothetical protein